MSNSRGNGKSNLKHDLVEEDLCELSVGKRQSPESEVGGGVGD